MSKLLTSLDYYFYICKMRTGLLYSWAAVSIKLIMPVEVIGYALTPGEGGLSLTAWRSQAPGDMQEVELALLTWRLARPAL